MRISIVAIALALSAFAQDNAPDSFTVLQVADLHFDGKDFARLKEIQALSQSLKPSMVFFTGDNCATGTLEVQKALKAETAKLGARSFYVRGNNDSENFEAVFGSSNYWFQYRGVKFVASSQGVDLELLNAGKLTGREGAGFFTDISWLRNALNSDSFTVFVSHSPLLPVCSLETFQLADLLLKGKPNLGIYGHLHAYIPLNVAGSIHVTSPDAVSSAEVLLYKFESGRVTVSEMTTAGKVMSVAEYKSNLALNKETRIEVHSRPVEPLAAVTLDMKEGIFKAFANAFDPADWNRVLKLYPVGRALQVKPQETMPEFVPKGKPLFTFFQLSDTHYSGGDDKTLEACLDFLSGTDCDFVILTGDNAQRGVLEQHRKLKEMLNTRMKKPYRIIKGDNDARHYEDVFGTSNYSFEYGGLRFVCMGMDSDKELAGYGFYDTAWLEKELGKNSEAPTFILTHVPVYPPLSMGGILAFGAAMGHENVNGFLAGHLHFDYEFEIDGKKSIMCPAATWNTNTIKEYRVYEDRIVMRGFSYDGSGSYSSNGRYQVIWLKSKIADCKRKFYNETFRTAKPTRFWDD